MYDEDDFPYNLGKCQLGSTVRADARSLARRNALLCIAHAEDDERDSRLALAVLHAEPDSPLGPLLTPGAEPLCTADESAFGGGARTKHAEIAFVRDELYLIM